MSDISTVRIADMLGVPETTLRRKLDQAGMPRSGYTTADLPMIKHVLGIQEPVQQQAIATQQHQPQPPVHTDKEEMDASEFCQMLGDHIIPRVNKHIDDRFDVMQRKLDERCDRFENAVVNHINIQNEYIRRHVSSLKSTPHKASLNPVEQMFVPEHNNTVTCLRQRYNNFTKWFFPMVAGAGVIFFSVAMIHNIIFGETSQQDSQQEYLYR
jgi:hypothetical protein